MIQKTTPPPASAPESRSCWFQTSLRSALFPFAWRPQTHASVSHTHKQTRDSRRAFPGQRARLQTAKSADMHRLKPEQRKRGREAIHNGPFSEKALCCVPAILSSISSSLSAGRHLLERSSLHPGWLPFAKRDARK